MIIELVESRNEHQTQDGRTVELIYEATWSDWTAGTGFPKIGDALATYTGWTGSQYEDVYCSDVQTIPVDNINLRVLVLFSTINKPSRPKAADERAWTLDIEVNTNETEIDVFYDVVSSSWKQWSGTAGYYQTEKGTVSGDDGETVPALILRQPAIVMRLTVYGEAFYPQSVLSNVGNTINSNTTFVDSLLAIPNLNINKGLGESYGTDTNEWMLDSCPVTQEGKELWRYDMTFLHSGMFDWNVQNGVDVNLYTPVNYITMLNNMKGGSADGSGGDRS